MSSISPLPGITPASHLASIPKPHRVPALSWTGQLVAHEESDLPGTIAIAASCLAAAWSLSGVVLGVGLLELFPYQLARLALYGATFLAGTIMAGGFLSRSRTAHYTAIVATTTIGTTYLALRLGVPPTALIAIKVGYGVALLGGVVVWGLRRLRHLILRRTADD